MRVKKTTRRKKNLTIKARGRVRINPGAKKLGRVWKSLQKAKAPAKRKALKSKFSAVAKRYDASIKRRGLRVNPSKKKAATKKRCTNPTTASVSKAKNLVDPSKPWVVRWRSGNMKASSFWYFATKAEATAAAARLRKNPTRNPKSKSKKKGFTIKAGGSLRINPSRKRVTRRRNTGASQYEKFHGRPSSRTDQLNMPNGTPAGIDKLGKLISISTAAGKIVPRELTWLCADSNGKLHLATKADRLIDGPQQSFGRVSRVEYETSKSHLGGGPTVYYHRFGEDDGHQPELYSDGKGGLKFRGGNYRITSAGIVN